MKKNIVVSSVLSAILLTAAALPASASPSAQPVEPGKTVTMQIATTEAKPAMNLIELVKQYSPETLQDWQDVLDKQKKHLTKLDNIAHTVTIVKLDGSNTAAGKQIMSKEAVPAIVGQNQQEKNFVIAQPITASATTMTISTEENKLFTDLNKAVEEKDIEAIKTNLAKLLEQFKTQATAVEKAAAK